uniref:Tetraspanin n=1 Tax=Glossina palpalis gambiensis TaxID=67801 RepID=A0A1B0BQU3_9MUSC
MEPKFIVHICGISLFAVGCELLNKMNLIPEYVIKLHILQFELPSVVIAVGIITTIFPLVGCIGALRESKCFLISYGTLLILTIIIQAALFCYLLCWSGEDIEHVLNIAWAKNTDDFKYPMDGYQFLFTCCGLKSYEDYLKNSKKIPSTCCGYLAGECEEEVYKERPGCRQTFWGAAEIILGCVVLEKVKVLPHYTHDVDVIQSAIPFLHIMIGSSTAVTPIFLVLSIISASNGCLIFYGVLSLMVSFMHLSSSIYFFVARETFSKRMDNLIEDVWSRNNEEYDYPMDDFQIAFDCCGVDNYQDYLEAYRLVPSSCCNKQFGCEEDDYRAKPGCRSTFVHFWDSLIIYICCRGMILGCLEVKVIAAIFYLYARSHDVI